jgi:hypothetical protein
MIPRVTGYNKTEKFKLGPLDVLCTMVPAQSLIFSITLRIQKACIISVVHSKRTIPTVTNYVS